MFVFIPGFIRSLRFGPAETDTAEIYIPMVTYIYIDIHILDKEISREKRANIVCNDLEKEDTSTSKFWMIKEDQLEIRNCNISISTLLAFKMIQSF